MIEIGTDGPADISDIRSRLSALNLGDVQVQTFGAPDDVLIRVEQQGEVAENDLSAVEKIRTELGEGVEYRRVEVVGPKVSGELVFCSFVRLLRLVDGRACAHRPNAIDERKRSVWSMGAQAPIDQTQ